MIKSIAHKIINLSPKIIKKRLQVIYFHEIVECNGKGYNNLNVKKFESFMNYLYKNNYKTLTFEDLNNPKLITGKKNVLITFDDGYINNYKLALPIMKKYNLKYNVFLEAGAINKKPNYLTWDMINEMIDSNLVGFGAHTYSHVDSRYINDNNINKEILYTNSLIEEKTGLKIEDFCFPYGLYDSKIVKKLTNANIYKRLYTSDGRKTKRHNQTYLIGRVGIKNEDSIDTFIGKIKGKYNIAYYINRKLKLNRK